MPDMDSYIRMLENVYEEFYLLKLVVLVLVWVILAGAAVWFYRAMDRRKGAPKHAEVMKELRVFLITQGSAAFFLSQTMVPLPFIGDSEWVGTLMMLGGVCWSVGLISLLQMTRGLLDGDARSGDKQE